MQPTNVMEPKQNSIIASKKPCPVDDEASREGVVHAETCACSWRPWPSHVPSTKARNTSMGDSVSSAIMAPMARVKRPRTTKILSLSSVDHRAPKARPAEAPTATATVLKSVPTML